MDTINDLKVGDLVLVSARVRDICENGAVCFDTIAREASSLCEYSFYLNNDELGAVIRTCAEKQKACRLFKKGDKVRVTPRDGRFPVVYPKKSALVVEDEDGSGFVQVRSNSGHKMSVAFFFLELVSPIEERRPYEVVETMSLGGWQIMRDGLPLVLYDGQLHPDAKAAAEAECQRLNEEWQTKVCRSEDGKEGE